MFVSLYTAQKVGEFWGKGVHVPGVFLTDKNGREEDEDTAAAV